MLVLAYYFLFIFDSTGLFVNENGIVFLPLTLQCFKSNDPSRLGLRGIQKGSVYVGNYVDDQAYIHLLNVEKHIKAGSLLDIW